VAERLQLQPGIEPVIEFLRHALAFRRPSQFDRMVQA
jgi:hypothetical protein